MNMRVTFHPKWSSPEFVGNYSHVSFKLKLSSTRNTNKFRSTENLKMIRNISSETPRNHLPASTPNSTHPNPAQSQQYTLTQTVIY